MQTTLDNDLFCRLVDHAPFMIWFGDDRARCSYFNNAWLEFTGRPVHAQIGHGWLQGIHPEDLESD